MNPIESELRAAKIIGLFLLGFGLAAVLFAGLLLK